MFHDQTQIQVEKKIEEARLSGIKRLEIPFMGLTKLPESLARLSHLEYLSLFGNNLEELPEWLTSLRQLKSLNISANRLNKLPHWIGKFIQLQSLEIYENGLVELPDSLGLLHNLQSLNLSNNQIEKLPESLGELAKLINLKSGHNQITILPKTLEGLRALQVLDLSYNSLGEIPEFLGNLKSLKQLNLKRNYLSTLPESLGYLAQLQDLDLSENYLATLPESFSKLLQLRSLDISNSSITDLPTSFAEFENLTTLNLNNTLLNPELIEANRQGIKSVKTYLRAKAESGRIILNEAKLIFVGEGEVGKTCLLNALRNEPFVDGLPSTHGIEIKSFKVINSEIQNEITLNGWDFGGQRVYRPTHQLFFSAPAVYLVVWKPREGPQQGFVKEWIQLVKRREPSAKILVVATHGGPQQRQPDINRQELWDLFGKDTVVDFFFVDSKPDARGHRKGIAELKDAIARVAATLPEVGRSVPKSFADVRAALQVKGLPYLSLDEVLAICRAHNMDDEIARLFITISHRLGHLTHYENDPALRDIVILRPDWLATAMSYVLDDEQTRAAHGLVKFSRLGQLWDDSSRTADSRYEATLHPIFLRLMERFDLSYRVADPTPQNVSDPLSLIGQLVPDIRPTNIEEFAWPPTPSSGDIQQTQICRIVDASNGQPASAEGLFYQLIVRLHKYSLGRVNYTESVHWQRGIVLDNAYNGRAFLQHIGKDIHITVRAPYPEFFLAMLTSEVKYLVESFWEGLRCEVTVPCLNPKPCIGLFEIEKLIENKRRERLEVPCPICNVWQSTDRLLLNAPAASQPVSLDYLEKQFATLNDKVDESNSTLRILKSQIDQQFADLIQLYTDEAKEGPRLFSLFPLDGNKFNPQTWVREKFRLVLWCEHSRLPLPVHNNWDMKKGVYDFELDREWFKRAVPFLKFMTGTLSLVLPMMSSTLKVVDDSAFKQLENNLSLGKSVIDYISGEGAKLGEVMGAADSTNLERGVGIRAENATLRELHALIKTKDPSNSFGGLVRVLNKRNEFLWVHEKFAGEY